MDKVTFGVSCMKKWQILNVTFHRAQILTLGGVRSAVSSYLVLWQKLFLKGGDRKFVVQILKQCVKRTDQISR